MRGPGRWRSGGRIVSALDGGSVACMTKHFPLSRLFSYRSWAFPRSGTSATHPEADSNGLTGSDSAFGALGVRSRRQDLATRPLVGAPRAWNDACNEQAGPDAQSSFLPLFAADCSPL